jgi:aerobic carbon-monoxide dehydrogenase medium subunit
MTAAPDVLLPSSEDEAVAAFGDGSGVTVIAGGTIVVPELTSGRLRPAKALLLGRVGGLRGISRDGSTVTIGAATPISELVELPAPIGPCAANVADGEIRAQATLGGNLCAGSADAPRGDLQGALLAVGAVARSAGADGVAAQPLEEFLPARESRLLLDVAYEEPAAGAFAALDRPHTHDFTALAVSAARAADGTVRVALTGAASHGLRLPSAEAKADDPEAAGAAGTADVTFADDALASAWYRERTLPVLVRRALTQLGEAP